MAELAKLLTFMYEDDRQRALAAYTEMFDEAEDEQMLLQALVSPLRQAVEVARAYNTGKQSLSTAPKPREGEEANGAFMDTICRIRAEALKAQPAVEVVNENQISLFDAPEAPVEEASEETKAAAEEAEAATEEAEAAEAVAETGEEAEVKEPAAKEEPEAENAEEEEIGAEEEEPDTLPAAEAEPAAAPLAAASDRMPEQKMIRKPRVPLLILFLLFAIPLGLIAMVLLLIPALVSLAAAFVCITVAVLAVTSALGSFPKIANLLVALGAALILLAVGLVFLMLFIWFLGGAIGGVINGLISLGGKWCYKEVPAK
ncbi:MAG: hypothetical protein ACSW8E_03215 [Clostridia bacterium]